MSTPPKSFNPWPWSIVVFFAIAITGVVTFVIFCNRHPSELVTADYYEQEIRHQQQMERVDRTSQLQGKLAVAFNAAANQVSVQLPADHARLKPAGQIQFYRPAAAGQDRSLPLTVDAAGQQIFDASAFTAGLWRVRVTWTVGDVEYQSESQLIIDRTGV